MNIEVVTHPAKEPTNRPALLFVHGVCHGAWCWEEFYMPFFAEQGWDCYALSLRGHCGSDGRENLDSFGLDDYVADVLQVIEHEGIHPIVIGHSMGGGITQLLMTRHPEKIAAAVLLASMPSGGLTLIEMLGVLKYPLGIIALIKLLMGRGITPKEAMRLSFVSNRVTQNQAIKYAALLQPESRRALHEIANLSVPAGKVYVPLFVIGSSQDIIFRQPAVLRTAAHFGTEAVVLDKGCHNLMDDFDWRESAGHIQRWLSEQIQAAE